MMSTSSDSVSPAAGEAKCGSTASSGKPKLAWLALGMLIGLVLAAVFLAYGQPGLILEQMNLRYCG